MRVVGGKLRGRALAAPKSQAIRPTADRLREALFNILVHAYGDPVSGARVLDLFAGTGALGIEAISRGAAFVLFVDEGAEARALLRDNVETLGLGGVTRIFRRDATKLGEARPIEPFTLAFLDPPYKQGRALPALAQGSNTITFSTGADEGTITLEGSCEKQDPAKKKNLLITDFTKDIAGFNPNDFFVGGKESRNRLIFLGRRKTVRTT